MAIEIQSTYWQDRRDMSSLKRKHHPAAEVEAAPNGGSNGISVSEAEDDGEEMKHTPRPKILKQEHHSNNNNNSNNNTGISDETAKNDQEAHRPNTIGAIHTDRSVNICTNDDDVSALTEEHKQQDGHGIKALPSDLDSPQKKDSIADVGGSSVQEQSKETLPPSSSKEQKSEKEKKSDMILEENDRIIASWKDQAITTWKDAAFASEMRLQKIIHDSMVKDNELIRMRRNLELSTQLSLSALSQKQQEIDSLKMIGTMRGQQCDVLVEALKAKDKEIEELTVKLIKLERTGDKSVPASPSSAPNPPESNESAALKAKDKEIAELTDRLIKLERASDKSVTSEATVEATWPSAQNPSVSKEAAVSYDTLTGNTTRVDSNGSNKKVNQEDTLTPEATTSKLPMSLSTDDDSNSDDEGMGQLVYSTSNTARARRVEEIMSAMRQAHNKN